jgi:GTPase
VRSRSDRLGEFTPVTVRSIHVQYTPVEAAFPGGSAAFAIRPKGGRGGGGVGPLASDKKKHRSWARKGMRLVDPALHPASAWEFTAEVLVLHHQTTLCVGYSPVVHAGAVVQAAKVTSIASAADGARLEAIRTGDRAVITARWCYRPEYLHPGDQLLFREGRSKGVGRVTTVACPNGSGSGGGGAGGMVVE